MNEHIDDLCEILIVRLIALQHRVRFHTTMQLPDLFMIVEEGMLTQLFCSPALIRILL